MYFRVQVPLTPWHSLCNMLLRVLVQIIFYFSQVTGKARKAARLSTIRCCLSASSRSTPCFAPLSVRTQSCPPPRPEPPRAGWPSLVRTLRTRSKASKCVSSPTPPRRRRPTSPSRPPRSRKSSPCPSRCTTWCSSRRAPPEGRYRSRLGPRPHTQATGSSPDYFRTWPRGPRRTTRYRSVRSRLRTRPAPRAAPTTEPSRSSRRCALRRNGSSARCVQRPSTWDGRCWGTSSPTTGTTSTPATCRPETARPKSGSVPASSGTTSSPSTANRATTTWWRRWASGRRGTPGRRFASSAWPASKAPTACSSTCRPPTRATSAAASAGSGSSLRGLSTPTWPHTKAATSTESWRRRETLHHRSVYLRFRHRHPTNCRQFFRVHNWRGSKLVDQQYIWKESNGGNYSWEDKGNRSSRPSHRAVSRLARKQPKYAAHMMEVKIETAYLPLYLNLKCVLKISGIQCVTQNSKLNFQVKPT